MQAASMSRRGRRNVRVRSRSAVANAESAVEARLDVAEAGSADPLPPANTPAGRSARGRGRLAVEKYSKWVRARFPRCLVARERKPRRSAGLGLRLPDGPAASFRCRVPLATENQRGW